MPDGNFTKHGLLAGDAAPPHRADWTIDQDWDKYTAAEHAAWREAAEATPAEPDDDVDTAAPRRQVAQDRIDLDYQNTTRAMRACMMAPAHIRQGSSVTYSSQPGKR